MEDMSMGESLEKEIMTADKSRTAERFQMYADTVSKLTAEIGNKGKKGAGK